MPGLSGPLTNIDQGGFASASFHSFADTLAWDAYSGDYGPNFVGLALNTGTHIVQHPLFGWQAFGGTVSSSSTSAVVVQPRDAVRRRVFLAPLGVLFTLDAGAFSQVVYSMAARTVQLTVLAAPEGVADAAAAPVGRLVVTQPAVVPGVGAVVPTTALKQDAGAWVIPFSSGQGTVTFTVSS